MKRILIALIVVAIIVAAWYLVPQPEDVVTEPPPPVEVPAQVAPPEPDPVSDPTGDAVEEIEEVPPPVPERVPLPPLTESDAAVLESAGDVMGAEAADTSLLVAENVLPRIVATIDALTARQVPGQLLPLEPPGTPFQANVDFDPPTVVTNAQGDPLDQYLLDPVNYRRYDPHVALLESIDGERFAAEYLHYAPLLEEAYSQLGYPEGGFTARLLEVIDHVLATPEVSGPVRLVKPEAYYEFVDPELEALSAGQKALIRMGGANAARVKDKLREFRAALGG